MTHLSRIPRRTLVPAPVGLALVLTLAPVVLVGQQPPTKKAPAQPAAAPTQNGGPRIAWVNSQLIIQQMPEYAQAESTLNKEVDGYRQEVQHLQSQLDSTIRAYDRQQIVLSPADRQSKESEIQQLQAKVQQRYNELQNKASDRERQLVGPLEDRVKGIIEGIRAERNLAMIFDVAAPNSGVVAADRSLDLTQLVIQRLKGAQ